VVVRNAWRLYDDSRGYYNTISCTTTSRTRINRRNVCGFCTDVTTELRDILTGIIMSTNMQMDDWKYIIYQQTIIVNVNRLELRLLNEQMETMRRSRKKRTPLRVRNEAKKKKITLFDFSLKYVYIRYIMMLWGCEILWSYNHTTGYLYHDG
jgi:hypothetical protein